LFRKGGTGGGGGGGGSGTKTSGSGRSAHGGPYAKKYVPESDLGDDLGDPYM